MIHSNDSSFRINFMISYRSIIKKVFKIFATFPKLLFNLLLCRIIPDNQLYCRFFLKFYGRRFHNNINCRTIKTNKFFFCQWLYAAVIHSMNHAFINFRPVVRMNKFNHRFTNQVFNCWCCYQTKAFIIYKYNLPFRINCDGIRRIIHQFAIFIFTFFYRFLSFHLIGGIIKDAGP